MRPQKRSRGRNGGGNPYHNNNPNRGGGGGGGGPRPPNRSQTFDSNGPNVKIRGNAYQVFERYLALAREAQSSGDRIAAENFFQHAEHYFRTMNANGEGLQNQQRPPQMPTDNEGFGESEQPEEAQMAQVQHAPPPPAPMPEDEELPSFITGRPE
ncbi:MAG TPA: DUF4167 domain-containing protein [Stellaceae bacterium]|nr:DUF4167 domain-containing protein [Stellaceae bacterium]